VAVNGLISAGGIPG